ncbi:MAG TPA: hypothetical protein VE992_06385 [Solirubrobacteraceae bacterium]|nr:hypothetical protein [Solirubrobacteraceae bacterium]
MQDDLSHSTHPQSPAAKPCGHSRHVGTCPCCQRAQLARWSAQLAQVVAAGAAARA